LSNNRRVSGGLFATASGYLLKTFVENGEINNIIPEEQLNNQLKNRYERYLTNKGNYLESIDIENFNDKFVNNKNIDNNNFYKIIKNIQNAAPLDSVSIMDALKKNPISGDNKNFVNFLFLEKDSKKLKSVIDDYKNYLNLNPRNSVVDYIKNKETNYKSYLYDQGYDKLDIEINKKLSYYLPNPISKEYVKSKIYLSDFTNSIRSERDAFDLAGYRFDTNIFYPNRFNNKKEFLRELLNNANLNSVDYQKFKERVLNNDIKIKNIDHNRYSFFTIDNETKQIHAIKNFTNQKQDLILSIE
jgi:hypothetical protein